MLICGGFKMFSVTPEGLEPPTDRTGICYSIQLNYGAIFSVAKISIIGISLLIFEAPPLLLCGGFKACAGLLFSVTVLFYLCILHKKI